MNRTLIVSATLTLGVASAVSLWLARSGATAARSSAPSAASATTPQPVAADTRATRVERGKHLVLTSACNDCHTPWKLGANGPAPDMTRLLSGHPEGMTLPPPPASSGPWIGAFAATNTAWAGPWGISYTANLTPDPETGLGSWDEATFIATIRTGRHLGRGRPVLPPMPIPVYQNFSDEELKSIFAYLQSIPAIKNRVTPPTPPAAPPKSG